MSARERLLAALEGSPEVRPGAAGQLVADLVAETIRDDADAIVVENDRKLWASTPGKHWAADLLRCRADDVEKDTRGAAAPHPGESTRAKRSAERLAAFFLLSTIGRREGGTR